LKFEVVRPQEQKKNAKCACREIELDLGRKKVQGCTVIEKEDVLGVWVGRSKYCRGKGVKDLVWNLENGEA
jgi:hypothetical protein